MLNKCSIPLNYFLLKITFFVPLPVFFPLAGMPFLNHRVSPLSGPTPTFPSARTPLAAARGDVVPRNPECLWREPLSLVHISPYVLCLTHPPPYYSQPPPTPKSLLPVTALTSQERSLHFSLLIQ